jgi:hypothetical protein
MHLFPGLEVLIADDFREAILTEYLPEVVTVVLTKTVQRRGFSRRRGVPFRATRPAFEAPRYFLCPTYSHVISTS